jgi:hypothetical protein
MSIKYIIIHIINKLSKNILLSELLIKYIITLNILDLNDFLI